uniref:Small-subunit processome Utp12 domain-containing protein n=1 Tax=Podarcis muralis TaxID=64176 RepID=A0A670JWA7_PODMU
MQREMEYEDSVAKEDQPVVPGETQGEAGLAGKKTIETVKAAERIMEAIELYREETAKLEQHKVICRAAGKEVPLPVNPILQAYGNISPSAYVLDVLKKVKSSELEESLLVLPFSYVPDLLELFNQHLQLGSEVELLCRALLFLLRIHFGRITTNQLLVKVMEDLKKTTISKVSQVRVSKCAPMEDLHNLWVVKGANFGCPSALPKPYCLLIPLPVSVMAWDSK